ncbi:MAG: IS5 family transposase, partial [Chlamydiota bacterium]
MHENMAKASKNRASKNAYISPNQLTLDGFETPFAQKLDPDNRWVKLSKKIPWDVLVTTYQSQLNNRERGAEGINPRVAIGAMILKHICNMSDRETVLQIQENMYMQYFIGYSSFSSEYPFDPSLFVEFRKRLGIEQINAINEKILGLSKKQDAGFPEENGESGFSGTAPSGEEVDEKQKPADGPTEKHKGKLITDATACPQDIAYPTDLNLLNDAREKSEQLIDKLYSPRLHESKPRTDRKEARKLYLRTAQKKNKSKKEIRQAIKKQLSYLRKNLKNINNLLDAYPVIPLKKKDYKYLLVINTLYEQQQKMFTERVHSIEDRIVSIHQPHVRPIVRGKANAYVEFGAKISVSLMNGFAFLDDLSWDAYNEGTRLMSSVEKYKERFGYYPEEVLADKIFCNRANRAALKILGIKLRAKPLGRPKAVEEHVSPGERNPIEGTFGQAKTAYGMNRIKARLPQTSESWIASIVLVLNLIKIIGLGCYSYVVALIFSARNILERCEESIRKLVLLEPVKMECRTL